MAQQHKIKIIFETTDTEDPTQTKRFGYEINKQLLTYVTTEFTDQYQMLNVSELKPVGDLTVFGQRMWRLMRHALETPPAKVS